ncbi:unnamed protein product [Polarella glacialis]|uniref:Transmembrane protein n=1 Tax=Polarella glacialis TaxID=89957 RepID=A0A813L5K3_POLGL|nr:unnamed protein product [Polarella glacialis]
MARKGQQYSASGRLAAGAVCVTLCLLASHTAFVSGPVSGPKSLRGTPASSSPQFESWAAAGALQAGSETTGPSAVAPQFQAAALAAVLALVAGLVPVSPARAEEAAAPTAAPTEKVAEAANYVATKQRLDAAKKEEAELKGQAPEKEERLKRQIEQMKKEEGGGEFVNRGRESKKENTKRRKVKEVQEKKPGSGFSFALPSLSLPSFSVPEEKSGPVKKVFISPADELDEDELPLSRENRPLLVLILLFPSAVYIFFWVAGSLDII